MCVENSGSRVKTLIQDTVVHVCTFYFRHVPLNDVVTNIIVL